MQRRCVISFPPNGSSYQLADEDGGKPELHGFPFIFLWI
jgi:hypothetical protein